ncbi:hypothetical protein FHG64_06300 [Antarcticibacterium flavum]|uniref:Uncharacterized protein n=1 Tax=Antarcticibacterium flavum TaxID=2058175 RepID=A0A5B7X111_9FLAO|nr:MULTISPECIES: hypothetical protein [Antarcticibacterium]MCM4161894.1 hypothetical protein [Antarcticibacterium sp. W02-3]QCY69047.1 hypothetical protein FHG64_06300 [Antarcticibacterium flavum]
MKKILLISVLLITTYSFSQDIKKESENAKTKMETFASKTGVITKFTDTNLSNLKSSYTVAETRVRKISSGDNERYFYQIEKPGKYSNSTASIEYSDLIEVIKAFHSLKSEVDTDNNKNPDYLENKFITEDGFQLGYFVRKGKTTWYMKLEKYGSDTTLFINDLDKIESNFIEAKNKIEELKL